MPWGLHMVRSLTAITNEVDCVCGLLCAERPRFWKPVLLLVLLGTFSQGQSFASQELAAYDCVLAGIAALTDVLIVIHSAPCTLSNRPGAVQVWRCWRTCC